MEHTWVTLLDHWEVEAHNPHDFTHCLTGFMIKHIIESCVEDFIPSFYLFLKRLVKERGRRAERSWGVRSKACTQTRLAGKPHVSQKRSSCLRLFLSFWVSLRSCRLLWVAPPFFPFCLALTREGTGGLVPLSFLAGCSSTHSWLWVSLCTCTGKEYRADQTQIEISWYYRLMTQAVVPLTVLFYHRTSG